ncbi:extracellular matrix/biofilm biosynthesis regulator RemA family protein [Peptoniphilus sp.]|jgi:regulator of extracellular matrix RemA (YlzA/DUF370 family)|uniref:extracellular matrix/biofilm biosynthesis regulator RemA family protein n=1 Tax=Peptoniphilus sp. TaxID=1971214 RepID=UPI003D8B4857
MINIGFGNMINESRIIAVLSPDSAPLKRLISDSRQKNNVIDATYGRKTRSIVVMDTAQIILASVAPQTIYQRLEND